jgi:lipopolysaccharide export LptBFGC system permease protein LptF
MISKIAIVFLLGVFAVLSLMVAAGGHNGFQYWSGLAFFVVCVLLAFYAVAELTGGHGKRSNQH